MSGVEERLDRSRCTQNTMESPRFPPPVRRGYRRLVRSGCLRLDSTDDGQSAL